MSRSKGEGQSVDVPVLNCPEIIVSSWGGGGGGGSDPRRRRCDGHLAAEGSGVSRHLAAPGPCLSSPALPAATPRLAALRLAAVHSSPDGLVYLTFPGVR